MGKLISRTGWQYVFYLLAGLGATTALAAFFAMAPDAALEDDKTDVDRRIDMIGGCLISAAICLFTYSLTDSGIAERGWAEPRMSQTFIPYLCRRIHATFPHRMSRCHHELIVQGSLLFSVSR
jgi:hypothetical protein